MKRLYLLIAILSMIFTSVAQENNVSKRNILVVDSSDSGPLPYSTVFSSQGEIVGFTNDDGVIAIIIRKTITAHI